MQLNANQTNLKLIIAILSTIIIGMSAYIIYNRNIEENNPYVTILAKKESESVIRDLEFLKSKYDKVISENINLSDEIIEERAKVVALISEIKNKNNSLAKYKNQLLDIKSKMIYVFDENFKLRNSAKSTHKEDIVFLTSASKNVKDVYEKNKFLEKQNKELFESIKQASSLTFLNFNATSYKTKNSGKIVATQSAKRADLVVINYTINQNKFANAGQKTLYFQIIDPENKVVGETKATTVSNEKLLYTFISKIAYNNKTEDFSQQIPFSSFSKGKYQVNVYDDNGLLAETNFEMK